MHQLADVVREAREIFGSRLLGMFVFGSRVAGGARTTSDVDLGVWLAPPIRRATSWVPWVARFGPRDPVLDPTFFTEASLTVPAAWLLEAVHGGVQVLYDPHGQLAERLASIRRACDAGAYRRRLFMGLPHWERSAA